MKKHQKVLLGLMVLGLAGGVGTAVALTRNAATDSTGGGLDQAIYLNWGNEAQNSEAQATVENLVAKAPQYRYLVVTTKATNLLKGNVTLTFTAATEEDTVMTGLTIDVYSVTTEKTSTFVTSTEEGIAPDKLEGTISETNKTVTSKFAVDGTAETSLTHYYTLVFTWDGTSPEDANKSIGANLTVSQDFAIAE